MNINRLKNTNFGLILEMHILFLQFHGEILGKTIKSVVNVDHIGDSRQPFSVPEETDV